MPVKGQKPQEEAYQAFQAQLDQAVEEVKDTEFLERLVSNTDYVKLIEMFSKDGVEEIEKSIKEVEHQLYTNALTPDKNLQLLETLKLSKARMEGGKDFMSFAEREVDRLKTLKNTIIPELKERLESFEKD